MKKFLGIFLILAVISCTTIPAFAASEPQFGGADMTVTAYSYGTFEFGIPESMHFDKNQGVSCRISIFNADILDTDSIMVTLGNVNEEGGITLNHTTKEDITANLYFYTDYNCHTKIRGDISEPLLNIPASSIIGFTNPSFEVYALLDEEAKAGLYSGTVNFNFSILSNS